MDTASGFFSILDINKGPFIYVLLEERKRDGVMGPLEKILSHSCLDYVSRTHPFFGLLSVSIAGWRDLHYMALWRFCFVVGRHEVYFDDRDGKGNGHFFSSFYLL